jgi:hypothetical protein
MYFGIYSKIRHVKQSKGEVYQKNKKQSKVSVMSQKRKKGFDVVKRLKSHEIEIDLFQRAPLTSCSRTCKNKQIIPKQNSVHRSKSFYVHPYIMCKLNIRKRPLGLSISEKG